MHECFIYIARISTSVVCSVSNGCNGVSMSKRFRCVLRQKAVVCFMLKKKEGCVLCQNVCRMFYAWTRCMLILYSGCLAKVRPKRREKSGLEREMAYGNGFISLNDKGHKSKREMAQTETHETLRINTS